MICARSSSISYCKCCNLPVFAVTVQLAPITDLEASYASRMARLNAWVFGSDIASLTCACEACIGLENKQRYLDQVRETTQRRSAER